jgi:hypothetical protein
VYVTDAFLDHVVIGHNVTVAAYDKSRTRYIDEFFCRGRRFRRCHIRFGRRRLSPHVPPLIQVQQLPERRVRCQRLRYQLRPASRPPWSVEEYNDACFIVRDRNCRPSAPQRRGRKMLQNVMPVTEAPGQF